MKNLKMALIALVGGLFLFSACEKTEKEAPIDMAKVKADIQAIESAYGAANNAKDIEAQVAYYADDAISYAPNRAPRVGKEAIKAEDGASMAKDTSGAVLSLTTLEVFAAGNYVTEIGTYAVAGPDGSAWDNGTFFTIFEKRDSTYVAIRDIWNSSNPKKDDDEDEDDDDDED